MKKESRINVYTAIKIYEINYKYNNMDDCYSTSTGTMAYHTDVNTI